MTFSISELPHPRLHHFLRGSHIQRQRYRGYTPSSFQVWEKTPPWDHLRHLLQVNFSLWPIYCCSPKYSSVNSLSRNLYLRVSPRENNQRLLVLGVVWRADSKMGLWSWLFRQLVGNEDSRTNVNGVLTAIGILLLQLLQFSRRRAET